MLPLPAGTRILTQAEAKERAARRKPALVKLEIDYRAGRYRDWQIQQRHRTTCEVCGEEKPDDGRHRCPTCIQRWGISC